MGTTSLQTGAVLACVLALLQLGGCSAQAGAPRMRLGSLPFPGVLSLYEEADPADLGMHCSGSPLLRLGHRGECERGTMYTRRAGFVDLSHVRESVDWVKYLHTHASGALAQAEGSGSDQPAFTFTACQSRFEVFVRFPDWWSSLAAETQRELAEEAAIRFAQRGSIFVSTWHEAATWLGYQTIPGVSEAGSAFTWDDTTSHVIAATVGGRALRNAGVEWDEAVTMELDDELRALEVVERKELHAAARSVRELWWKGATAIRRDFDTGLEDDIKVGWLVPKSTEAPLALTVASLADVQGYDLTSLFDIRIVPPRWMMRKLYGNDSDTPDIRGESGLLDACEQVRLQMQERWGQGFDRPE